MNPPPLAEPETAEQQPAHAQPRRGHGRRHTDGAWTITPRAVGLIGGLLTIILALFSPVFYVRDMASTVRDVQRSVDKIESAQRTDRDAQAADHAAIIVLQAQAAQSAAQRADHENRIRELERNR